MSSPYDRPHGHRQDPSTDVVVIVALVALGIFLLLIVGLFLLIDHYESESNKAQSAPPGAATSSSSSGVSIATGATSTK